MSAASALAAISSLNSTCASHARLPRCHEFAHDPHDGLIASRDHRRHGVDETRLDDARSFYREGVEARLDDEARQRLRQADI